MKLALCTQVTDSGNNEEVKSTLKRTVNNKIVKPLVVSKRCICHNNENWKRFIIFLLL